MRARLAGSADEFFSRVDVAVFPSVWDESFGLVAAEAMEAGCPVIVSDAGGLPEVVGPDHPWVVPRGDAAALADVLADAIDALPADETTAAQHRRWEVRVLPRGRPATPGGPGRPTSWTAASSTHHSAATARPSAPATDLRPTVSAR